MDRLITELKLPPSDAYHKLRHTIEEVNAVIAACAGGLPDPDEYLVDPVRGNVAFSAALYGWSFTLTSFSQLYADVSGGSFDPRWGVWEQRSERRMGGGTGGLKRAIAVCPMGPPPTECSICDGCCAVSWDAWEVVAWARLHRAVVMTCL